ncbi:MAG: site-2 protease family protein [Polyangiaceae bacterium]|nr:site-2 protease family protein [Polyangiaceae bacterium]
MSFNPADMAAWFVVFVFSTTCHEAAHAWAAWRGGDSTAYEGGQVSLDPFPHIRREPMGMVLVPILTYLSGYGMLGWASAPYDPVWGRRFPRRQAVMSLAGPAANLLLAAVAFGALKGLLAAGIMVAPARLSMSRMVEVASGNPGSALGALATALSILLTLNVLLGLFNLLPLPPLDGSGILAGLSPRRVGPIMTRIQEQPMMGMLGLVIAWYLFKYGIGPALTAIRILLHPGILYS